MSGRRESVEIHKVPTGVPGLDEVLLGGLPEYSFNLIAGAPGTGKTTMAQQIMFNTATADRRALYFTVLGEPTIKMLRYQQQYSFFDFDLLDGVVRFINLSQEVAENDLGSVLEKMIDLVEEVSPEIVVVDSFRTIVRASEQTPSPEGEMSVPDFLQRLALHLTSWHANTFLVGEYLESEIRDNPVFTVADGIFWLFQDIHRNSIVRKLQVIKMRGQATVPGLHNFRITDDGVQVFPRLLKREQMPAEVSEREAGRLSTGEPTLDEMLGGGLPAGDSAIVAGPSGSGKTILTTQFVTAGVASDAPAVIAIFEENPREYVQRVRQIGLDVHQAVEEDLLRILYLRPLDLSVDETLKAIREAVHEIDADRVVIDSLSGFEIALAPTFRQDFRESLYRMVGALTDIGVTVLMTVETTEGYTELSFTPHAISFLTDDIILQRYMELEGRLSRFMTVVKMRGSDHSNAMREYRITKQGIEMGRILEDYEGLITGVPSRRGTEARAYPGLSATQSRVLEALMDRDGATIEELQAETGLDSEELRLDLDRLAELHYVLEEEEEGTAVYRLIGRPLGR